jgi:phage-related protein
VKPLSFNKSTLSFIREQSVEIKKEIGEALRDIQKGILPGLPLSRPMPSVGAGVHELRVGDGTKTVRVFYFIKYEEAILVFHAFEKRSQKTPPHEIEIGKKRLKELLYGKE